MTIKDKKEELQKLIEQSDNEDLINYLHAIIKDDVDDSIAWDNLPHEFREELFKRHESIKDASTPFIKNEVVFEKYNAWLSR
jgi:hypothetical protein